MDILNILQDVGVIFTKEQKLLFKKEFHKYYKNVNEIQKLKKKLKAYQRQIEMYSEELNDFKEISNTYKQKYENIYKELNYLLNANKIREAGISEQYLNFVQLEVLQYVNESTDFKSALQKYVEEHPQYKTSKRF